MTTTASASKPWQNHAALSRPLYAYDLGKDLIDSLALRSFDALIEPPKPAATSSLNQDVVQPKQQQAVAAEMNGSVRGCPLCPGFSTLPSPSHLRAHTRSDWHRYNLALTRRGAQAKVVDEEQFANQLDELDSEGTDSSSSSSDENNAQTRPPVDVVRQLLEKVKLSESSVLSSDDEDLGDEYGGGAILVDSRSARAALTAKEPFLWFVTKPDSATFIEQTQLGILRSLFVDVEDVSGAQGWQVRAVERMQAECLSALPSWVGGHARKSGSSTIKRLKGDSGVDEAASLLGAVFLDAKGVLGASEEASDSDDSEGETAEVASSTTTTLPPLKTWTIILMGGGHFSASIVALNPHESVTSKKKATTERQLLVLAHKAFHRYTTRRKQGGAQSSQDASGRFAKSAGAQLRRYGEQALAEEVRELLGTSRWRRGIEQSEKVWIRAGGRSARGVLYGWPGAQASPLEGPRQDGRMQSLPLATTRKPTVGETLRCFAELTRVKVRHESEEEMQRRDEEYKAQLEGSARERQERKERKRRELQAKQAQIKEAKPKVPVLDEEEKRSRELFARMVEMINKGRLEAFTSHLQKHEADLFKASTAFKKKEPDDADDAALLARERINSALPTWWRVEDARAKSVLLPPSDSAVDLSTVPTASSQLVPSTILHLAAESGQESIVSYLLHDRRADPTFAIAAPPRSTDAQPNAAEAARSVDSGDFPRRTAYDICSSKAARDVFRRMSATHPDLCNWKEDARVPSALTDEMVAANEKRNALKERARLREVEEQRREAEAHEREQEASIREEEARRRQAQAAQPSSAIKNRLGGGGGGSSGSAPASLLKKRDEAAGLTPEMKARIEREKRARAAEARMKALQGGQ